MEALAASRRLGGLVLLDVASNALGDAGVVALAASKFLRPESLELSGTRLGDRGVEALAGGPVLRQVAELHLNGNRVGDRGLLALSRSRWVRRLRHLTLCGNPVTNRGLVPLCDRLPGLKLQLFSSEESSGSALDERFGRTFSGRARRAPPARG